MTEMIKLGEQFHVMLPIDKVSEFNYALIDLCVKYKAELSIYSSVPIYTPKKE
jgi:hypothetical protein